jgi:protein gp37
MSDSHATGISWCDETWNPVHGCTRCSRGCQYCYAERYSHKFDQTNLDWVKPNAEEVIQIKREKLDEPASFPQFADEDWADNIPDGPSLPSGRHPRRIFVNSMSDLFHPLIVDEEVPAAERFLEDIVEQMRAYPEYIFLILTKRAEKLVEASRRLTWPDNVWLGVSVETADYTSRIEQLAEVPCQTRFVSFEPLVDNVTPVDLEAIDWAIVGGETQPDGEFTELDHEWAREVRQACNRDGCAYFFKQDSGYTDGQRPWLELANGQRKRIQEFPGIPSRTIEAQPPQQSSLTDTFG